MPLKTDPKYGYYPWWPEDGDAWLHPEDVAAARSMIPSPRVFRRDGQRGDFVVLHYGSQKVRVRRTLWREIDGEGYDIDDWVEVLSRGMKNTPRTAQIAEMHWDDDARAIRYYLIDGGKPIPNGFLAADLRHVELPESDDSPADDAGERPDR